MRGRPAVEHPLSLWFSAKKKKIPFICSAIVGKFWQVQMNYVCFSFMFVTVISKGSEKMLFYIYVNLLLCQPQKLKHGYFTGQMGICLQMGN